MLRSVFGKCQTIFRQTVIGPRKICRYSPKVLPRVIIGITTCVASYYSLKKSKIFNLEEFVEKHLVDPTVFGEQTNYEYDQQRRLFQYLPDELADELFCFLLGRVLVAKDLDENEVLLPLFQWQYAWQMVKAVAVTVEQASPAVVRIFCNDDGGSGVGTGFFVDKEGLILTNSHVVQKEKRVTVITADDKLYHGDVLSYDTKLDLAVIQIQGATKEFTTIKLGDSDEVRGEDSVIAIGSPDSIKLGVMSGTVLPTFTEDGDDELVIKTHIPSYPGASGSPIINQNGEAIGVIHKGGYYYWFNNWTGKPRGPPFCIVSAIRSNEAKKFLTDIKNQDRKQAC